MFSLLHRRININFHLEEKQINQKKQKLLIGIIRNY